MTNNAELIVQEIDKVSEGFERVDIVPNPPHIKWGDDFNAWDTKKQVDYLKKFAEAMNFAAKELQVERDEFNRLLLLKERQLEKMQCMMDNNNNMLQSEVTKMNEYKNKSCDNVQKLNARIKELENDGTSQHIS